MLHKSNSRCLSAWFLKTPLFMVSLNFIVHVPQDLFQCFILVMGGDSGVGVMVAQKWTQNVIGVTRINDRLIVVRLMAVFTKVT